MDIRFLIEQLDEITRRGFLANLGAVGAAGYYGKQELDKSKEKKQKRNAELSKVYQLQAGDTKSHVKSLLGEPDDIMDHGVWTKWTYESPYALEDDIHVTFGKSYGTWESLDNRVVMIQKGSRELVGQDEAFRLLDVEKEKRKEEIEASARREFARQQEKERLENPIPGVTEIPGSKLDPKTGAYDYSKETNLEETSDEAIARIVELSKDKK